MTAVEADFVMLLQALHFLKDHLVFAAELLVEVVNQKNAHMDEKFRAP
jgi:hypothetical protein